MTGTFMNPRQVLANPQNEITGTLYMVNSGHDPISVNSDESKLRFWRNITDVDIIQLQFGQKFRSSVGLIGYECDVFVDDCHRPIGLVTLSTTSMTITDSLLRDYGAHYDGNGTVEHQLVLYRHQSIDGISALVLRAGTIQFTFALAPHDGQVVSIDPSIQQATINMLANIYIQPLSLKGKLHLASPSTDSKPPVSTIILPLNMHYLELDLAQRQNVSVVITGTAKDDGGGQVAGVEVSVDVHMMAVALGDVLTGQYHRFTLTLSL